jgi:response regulator RpfG family c-di-GMP phosphodiesterase
MTNYKVLFVDDEPDILSAIKRIFFANENIEIFTGGSAADGLEILEREKNIDLVVSDERMPEVRGSEFLQTVKTRYPNAIRMILTGYADIDTIISSINKGEVYRYLVKPWNDDDLLLTIKKALEFNELRRKNEDMAVLIARQNNELKTLNTKLEEKVNERTVQLKKALVSLKHYIADMKHNFRDIVLLFTGIITLYQKDLGAHLFRVYTMVKRICSALDLPEDEKMTIVTASMLHDIGLVGVRSDILLKDPAEFSVQDKAFYLQHPISGEAFLSRLGSMEGLSVSSDPTTNASTATDFPTD